MATRPLLVRSARFHTLLTVSRLDECSQDKSKGPQKLPESHRRLHAAKERATRLRELRPDISKIGERVTVEDAMALGGYESVEKMDRDLAKRARKISL